MNINDSSDNINNNANNNYYYNFNDNLTDEDNWMHQPTFIEDSIVLKIITEGQRTQGYRYKSEVAQINNKIPFNMLFGIYLS